jgi:hypothetical protein
MKFHQMRYPPKNVHFAYSSFPKNKKNCFHHSRTLGDNGKKCIVSKMVNPQSIWINYVTHVLHLSMKELTLAWMKLKFKFKQLFQMIFWGQAKNNDVINVTIGKN